ncbi:hypothetical protein B0H12DRAFT_1123996 [Mycena haematopus]|nr:hypothetical protein B0H12DRAFT_1123996 [Mycena haematopus]
MGDWRRDMGAICRGKTPASEKKDTPELEQVSVHSCRIAAVQRRGGRRGGTRGNNIRVISMSSNPRHYNVADRVKFENYADDLRQFGAGLGPYPGETPVGYREYFRVGHKYAPIPEDYPHRFRKEAEVPRTAAVDVSMSAVALGTILESQQKMMHSVMAIRDNRPVYDNHHLAHVYQGNRSRFYRGSGFGGYRGRGGRGAYGGRALVDRIGDQHAGGGRGRTRRNRQQREDKTNDDDIASDVATAGGLTDNESEYDAITPDDIPEEEGEVDDNGFNVDLIAN